MARRGPSVRVIALAIAVTEPLSPISLPNSAPSRNREELGEEARRAAHEGLGPVGEQRFAREGGRDRGRDRGEQQHAPAPIGERDQQCEADEDPGEAQHRIRPWSTVRRDR